MSSAKTQCSYGRLSRLPPFVTYEEEAEFWDSHDLTDFSDEFETVEWKVDRVVSLGMMLPHDLLDDDVWDAIDSRARAANIDPTLLVKPLILAGLSTDDGTNGATPKQTGGRESGHVTDGSLNR